MKPAASLTILFSALILFGPVANAATERPNILWLSCEDISAHIGCFGDPHAITPNLDQLAKEGVRYTNAFTTAGVCAPCRSGIITGMYQTTLGTHHMRCSATLPKHVKPFPMYLREAGYYCTNNSKQDYQFKTPKGTWDDSSRKAHWKKRPKKDQPFFAVFNFTGCHESGIASESKYKSVTKNLKKSQRQDPRKLTLPPYYPDTPVVREDWKRNYELITAMDAWAGQLIQELKDEGLYDETIILFWSDHGVGLPRGKRWLYDSGTHIPLVVRAPEEFGTGIAKANSINDELVSSIDFGPTALNLAGVAVQKHMQGRAFLGANRSQPRDYVYGGRDRMDERYDIIRMARDRQYKYIRNYEPLKTYYQYMNTPEKGATMKEIRRVAREGKLPPAAKALMAKTKAVEELYDTKADPYEINNLAADPKHENTLKRLRAAHMAWVADSKDVGLIPEPELAIREKKLGSRYAILRQKNVGTLVKRIRDTASLAVSGLGNDVGLVNALKDDDAAVRYWAATGIGNNSNGAPRLPNGIDEQLMTIHLTDSSPSVRIAAARALCRMGKPEKALPVLTKELRDGGQWTRLNAAIVLDEIDDMATPVLNEMKKALKYRKDLIYEGKYTVRVTNRALNELLGTDNTVK